MTKLATDIKKKKELDENEEYFRQVDRPEGWKFVGEYEGDKLKKNKKKQDDAKGNVQSKKRTSSYQAGVAEYLQKKMIEMDAGDGWILDAIPTKHKGRVRIYGRGFDTQRGVVAVLKTPRGRVFIKAMGVCGYPEIDIRATNTLAEEVENTIDSEKGLLLSDGLRKTESGIILPR